MTEAVLLAGSPNSGPLRAVDAAAWEALIPVGGVPMVTMVARVLLAVPEVTRLAVVAPPEVHPVLPADERIMSVPAGDSLMENLARGLAAFPGAPQVLVATADIPLLTPAAVEDFLARCGDRTADIYYPVAEEKVVSARYPNVKRTYVRLRDGRFTGGNIALFRPAAFARCRAKGEEFAAYRKKPLKLARVVGLGFLLRFISGRVTLRDAEHKVTSLVGISGRVVVTPFPEVAVDVDKPGDLELAREILGGA